MGKLFHSFWLRLVVELIVWQGVVLGLSWLIYWRMNWVRYFSDVLFLVGALELMGASIGMLRNPYRVFDGGWGVPALPTQPTEEERREQALAEYIQQRLFAVRMGASGVLTIVAAVIALQF